MKNMLFIFEREMPLIKLLREKYGELTKCKVEFLPLLDVREKDIDNHDIIVFVRPSDPLSLKISKNAKQSGAFTVFYTDDDLLNLPSTSPFSATRKKTMNKIAQYTETVLAANPHICRKYSQIVPSHRYAETITSVDYLDLQCIDDKLSGQGSEKTKIVYAAGNGHERLFEQFIRPILPRLNEKYHHAISLDFVGVHPDVGDMAEKMEIRYTSGMSLAEYRTFMSNNSFDLGVAPLEGTEFDKCKHYSKYLEYTSAGMVGVYSNCEPFTNAVTDHWNGLLADNDTDSWFDAICYGIDHADQRREYLKNARDHILTQYTKRAFEEKLYCDIPELLSYEKTRTSCRSLLSGKLQYTLFRLTDRIYLFLFYLKNNKGYIAKKIESVLK